MPVLIYGVEENSIAQECGIEAGTVLISINEHEINDVLDFRFFEPYESLTLLLEKGGVRRSIEIEKEEYEEIGLIFETYLMDKQKSCKNKCIFCFIDQLPKGMRESLYFKDDDSRLSFLFGNYMTLTNMTEKDIDRILMMHISPVNVSVHTMNPDLRVEMMKNPNAGKSIDMLKKLASGGIDVNCQLVLCPGINDGKELEYSLTELMKLTPAVKSIALVPVGLTKHREGLCNLRLFSESEALEVINTARCFAEKSLEENGSRIVYAADEFYIKAGVPFPSEEEYEEFAQLENGVGLVVSLESEFERAVEDSDGDARQRTVTIATGVSAAPILEKMLDTHMKKWASVKYNVVPIANNFFGETITVAGLVTGRDLIAQLKGKSLGDELLIPRVMLRHEGDMFLDDTLLEDVERELSVPVRVVSNDGYEFLDAVLGE